MMQVVKDAKSAETTCIPVPLHHKFDVSQLPNSFHSSPSNVASREPHSSPPRSHILVSHSHASTFNSTFAARMSPSYHAHPDSNSTTHLPVSQATLTHDEGLQKVLGAAQNRERREKARERETSRLETERARTRLSLLKGVGVAHAQLDWAIAREKENDASHSRTQQNEKQGFEEQEEWSEEVSCKSAGMPEIFRKFQLEQVR